MGKPRGAFWGEGCAEIAAGFNRPKTRREHERLALDQKRLGLVKKRKNTQFATVDYWRSRAMRAETALQRKSDAQDFYASEAWRTLRYQALKASNRKCQLCGNTGELHVDHIKPRSKHPELALVLSNLQVLCKDCNLGKGAWDATDWRKGNLATVPDNA